jgi:hypothetical protein
VDERVAMAISHRAPRFTANGVTAGDFGRITGGLERWEDWCAAWSAVGAGHEALGRAALGAGRELSAGAHEAFRVRPKAAGDEAARAVAGPLSLAGRAKLIRCPLPVVMAKQDRLIPWQDAARLAGAAA